MHSFLVSVDVLLAIEQVAGFSAKLEQRVVEAVSIAACASAAAGHLNGMLFT